MTLLIISIDTEEDNWYRSRDGVSVGNIRELPRLARFFERLNVQPTYLVNYQVAIDPCSAAIVREVSSAGSRAEIGAHLHPWNTPPLDEAFVPRNSMLKNLPADLQQAKLNRLTQALEQALDCTPRVFRAGRFGVGPETVGALLRCGYRVDSSVTPFWNWESYDEGPSFVGAPIGVYRLAPGEDVRRPSRAGALIEIPLSYGFSRGPFSFWDPARRLLESEALRWLHLAGIADRTGLARRTVLCPELASARDMLTLSRRLLEHGAQHLQIFFHSPSLTPGLSPFVTSPADVAHLYDTIEAYLDGVAGFTDVRFATISEAAALLA
ncbi:MAG TPA: hypothetical protein VGU74_08555 [Gemmatimonadales bacterium]|nr:hypothetical protein [Gemmatimonadales bacterium]